LNLQDLRKYLEGLSNSLDRSDQALLRSRVQSLASVFPFNEYEYTLMFLLGRQVLTFEDYEKLRSDYISANQYLSLYGLAPRIFGEIWAHQHLMDLDNRFEKPSKQVDPNYEGEYDLWIQSVRTEVKTARAINTRIRGDVVSKALKYGSPEPFWMNFQQLKPDRCDVFVFIGVWVDSIVYWVLSSQEVRENKHLSHQHRGGVEYQIGVTEKNISLFDEFRVTPSMVANVVIRKGLSY